MSGRGIVIFGEGIHELGSDLERPLTPEDLPALPQLVHRLLGCPADITYMCRSFKQVKSFHGAGGKFAKKGRKLAKKVIAAGRRAKQAGQNALAIVIDRDRKPDKDRIRAMREGRDSACGPSNPPCAVGCAVEMFDAWMICDEKAIEAAEGDSGKAHQNPESLAGGKKADKYPKTVADEIFGTKSGVGLGPKYAVVAEAVDIEMLEERCPRGFAPFAKEVREKIAPVLNFGENIN